ncbi:MAG: hypothetical protein H0X38_17630 [Planctomycetes bacterium]|nr:hypothetical protein [Planctomycetota bacterium]
MIRVVRLVALVLGACALAPAVEIGAWDFERAEDTHAWRGLGGPNAAIVAEDGGNILDIAARDSRHTVMVSCQIALDPAWRRLTVATRMRASGLVLGAESWQDARLAVEFHGADGRLVGYGAPAHLRGDAPWTPLRSEMEIPADATTVVLVAANFARGGACAFDDIRVSADAQHELVPTDTYRADFATLDRDGLPPGWCLSSAQAHVVAGALALDAAAGAVEARALIAVDPAWRRVRIACRLSALGLVVGADPSSTARLDIDPLDAEGRPSQQPHPVPSLTRDAEWHQQAVDVDLPTGTRWLLLRPHHSGLAGVFLLDDITCSPRE